MARSSNQPLLNSEARYPDSRLSVSKAAPQEEAAATSGTDKAALERAEELVDRFGERIGHYAGVVGRGLRAVTARAREQVEDIWAEAQHLRGQGRS